MLPMWQRSSIARGSYWLLVSAFALYVAWQAMTIRPGEAEYLMAPVFIGTVTSVFAILEFTGITQRWQQHNNEEEVDQHG